VADLKRKYPDGSTYKNLIISTVTGLLLLLLTLEVYFSNQGSEGDATATWEAPIDDFYNGLFAEYPMVNYGSYFALEPGLNETLWGRRFRTNQQGFRSPELKAQKSPGTVRVGIMGTCISLGELDTSGDGYSTVTAAMEEILQREYPALEFEVVNASVPGSYERTYLEHYRAVLRALEFDVLFVEVGTLQIVDPAKMLKVYRDSPVQGEQVVPNSVATPLHDVFARSALIRKLYDFQASHELLFDQYFRRHNDELSSSTPESAADMVESFDRHVLKPGAEHYRRQLTELLTELSRELPVIAFSFSHALPALDEDISVKQNAQLKKKPLVRGVPQTLDRDVDAKLNLFHRSYNLVDKISAEVAQATELEGRVTYVQVRSFPAATRSSNHHPGYYFLSINEGSRIRGQILANQLIDNGWLDAGNGPGMVERPTL
jgi:hypothetical protein